MPELGNPRPFTLIDGGLEDAPPFPRGGGGNGGPFVDIETQRYVDVKTEATRAQNDARFAEVITNIGRLSDKIDSLPTAKSQIAATVATGFGIFLGLIAVLSYAADRFDGGMSASTDGAVSKEVVSQNSDNIKELTGTVRQLMDSQAVENQKMIDALADHHEGQRGFEKPK